VCVRACVRGTIRCMFKTSNSEAVQEMAVAAALLYGCQNLYEVTRELRQQR